MLIKRLVARPLALAHEIDERVADAVVVCDGLPMFTTVVASAYLRILLVTEFALVALMVFLWREGLQVFRSNARHLLTEVVKVVFRRYRSGVYRIVPASSQPEPLASVDSACGSTAVAVQGTPPYPAGRFVASILDRIGSPMAATIGMAVDIAHRLTANDVTRGAVLFG